MKLIRLLCLFALTACAGGGSWPTATFEGPAADGLDGRLAAYCEASGLTVKASTTTGVTCEAQGFPLRSPWVVSRMGLIDAGRATVRQEFLISPQADGALVEARRWAIFTGKPKKKPIKLNNARNTDDVAAALVEMGGSTQ